MKPNKEELLKNYNIDQHFQIPCCIVDNPKLDKMLTGEGAKVAREMYPEFIGFDAKLDKEDRYKLFKVAQKINNNPDVAFFTCVASRNLQDLHIDFWGTDDLLTAARLVEENGEVLLGLLTNEQR